jgi:hypothetical protein
MEGHGEPFPSVKAIDGTRLKTRYRGIIHHFCYRRADQTLPRKGIALCQQSNPQPA